MNKARDPFLKQWELDLTTKAEKNRYLKSVDFTKQHEVEKLVSRYIQENFSFIVVEVKDKNKRLNLESKLISTISLCEECKPSAKWLGLFSTKSKIRESGLWLVNELYKTPLSEKDLVRLSEIL